MCIRDRPSLSLAFTGQSTIGKGSKLPRWEVHCNKKTVWLGPKAFLILLSCVVAAKLEQEGINVNSPQIKDVKLGTNIITPAKNPDRRGQQVNQNFSNAGIKIHVLDTGRPKEKARYLMLSSKLSPNSISLDPLKKSSNEAIKFLLNIHRKHS